MEDGVMFRLTWFWSWLFLSRAWAMRDWDECEHVGGRRRRVLGQVKSNFLNPSTYTNAVGKHWSKSVGFREEWAHSAGSTAILANRLIPRYFSWSSRTCFLFLVLQFFLSYKALYLTQLKNIFAVLACQEQHLICCKNHNFFMFRWEALKMKQHALLL